MSRELTFTSVDLREPGVWASYATAAWPAWTQGLRPGALEPEAQAAALALFDRHTPELSGVRDKLAAELDEPAAAAVLTHSLFASPFSACAQTVVGGALVRNYDFNPDFCDRTIACSDFLRPVIGMGDMLWGLLDGMNDAGLAVSLTFGGRTVTGEEGFTVLLIVRYLLETCTSVDQAWAKLQTVPCGTSQNLTLTGPDGSASVYLGPDRPARRLDDACVTNHQDYEVSPEQEQDTTTVQRLRALMQARDAAASAADPVEFMLGALLDPPLFQRHDWGTAYTAAYRPADGRVSYVWPGVRLEQSFADFQPGTLTTPFG